MDRPVSALAVWALGVTQIFSYGTLYYAFTILTPAIGHTYGWTSDLARGTVMAGLFLIFPGVVSDVIALTLLLLPGPRVVSESASRRRAAQGTLIEGEFRRTR